jgi:hypothetical protein
MKVTKNKTKRRLVVKIEELESRLKALEEQNIILQNQVRTIQDVEEIKTLQRAYGYYIEHFMTKEVVDCFADDPGIAVHFIGKGSYIGREALQMCFAANPEKMDPPSFHEVGSPEFLHIAMQLSPVININPDGNTAMGRWYGMGDFAIPRTMNKGIYYKHWLGLYENEYLKQNGKWKIKILKLAITYSYRPEEGFVKKERLMEKVDSSLKNPEPKLLIPTDIEFEGIDGVEYPSGYILPFHFKHPVTGNETSEKAWNTSLKGLKKKVKP